MAVIPRNQDGGECWRRWYRSRLANLSRLSGQAPKNLCLDELNITVCIRWTESLLNNSRVKRYLAKHHISELKALEKLVADFAHHRACVDAGRLSNGSRRA